jgi:cyclohexyl-isocyanide hydratase
MTGFTIGFVVFPGMTQLDCTAPLQVLARVPQASVHVIAKRDAPVDTDCGLRLLPTCTFADCHDLDLICVPGGFGVVDAVRDKETLDFVRRQAGKARYITSVCTGAFVLGAAGLLKQRRATTHWAYTDLLALVGAVYVPGRVVRHGNLFTAGGVTSGLDFALTVAAELAGEAAAQAIQLSLEYDPAPPFDAGHPERAPAAVRAGLDERYARSRSAYRTAIAAAVSDA